MKLRDIKLGKKIYMIRNSVQMKIQLKTKVDKDVISQFF